MPGDVIAGTRARYVEAYEQVSGSSFDAWYGDDDMRFAVRIDVTHLPGVLDPQGATVERALPALGYANVSEVSIGKTIRLVARRRLRGRGAGPGRRDVPAAPRQPGDRALHGRDRRSWSQS